MIDINKYNTEENRQGIRRLYAKYTGASLSDLAVEFIIQDITMYKEDMDFGDGLRECLHDLAGKPGDRELFKMAVCCLRSCPVIYYDEPEGDYPSFSRQLDPESGEMAYLLYTRTRKIPNKQDRKVYKRNYVLVREITDMLNACGCTKLIIDPGSGTPVLCLVDVMDYLDRLYRASASLEHIFRVGVEGEDLFPLAVVYLDCFDVVCTLKDGTELSGEFDYSRYVYESDEFINDPTTDAYNVWVDVYTESEEEDPDDEPPLSDEEWQEKYVYHGEVPGPPGRTLIIEDGKRYLLTEDMDEKTGETTELFLLDDDPPDFEDVPVKKADIALIKFRTAD